MNADLLTSLLCRAFLLRNDVECVRALCESTADREIITLWQEANAVMARLYSASNRLAVEGLSVDLSEPPIDDGDTRPLFLTEDTERLSS